MITRRTVLQALALLPSGIRNQESEDLFLGALPPLKKSFGQKVPLRQEGIGEGQKAHLWKGLNLQCLQQNEGDCVGHAYGTAVDVLTRSKTLASIEAIYGGSRVQIGNISPYIDGSRGIWAVKFLNQYGVLHRLRYKDIDLTGYSPERSDTYGRLGIPDALIPIAKRHPCASFSLIKTWSQVRDSLYLGHPVVLCSSYAFERERDSHGFAKQLLQSRRRWRNVRPRWFHAMPIIGYDDTTSRPGALILNSWHTDWITGPKRFDQPDGSFWATPEEIERMLNDWDDCFSISNYVGKHRLY